MSFLKRLGKKLKSGVKKLGHNLKSAVKSKLVGALASVIPGVGPVISTLAKASALKSTLKGAIGPPDIKKAAKAAVKKAISKRVSLPSVDVFKGFTASSNGFGTMENPLSWPVGDSPGDAGYMQPQRQQPVSIERSLRRIREIKASVYQSTPASYPAGTGGPLMNSMGAALPALRTAGAGAMRTYGPGLLKMGKKAAEAAGYLVTGMWIVDETGNIVGQVKRAKMNYMNGRAAKRAVRRVKGAMKLLRNIERMLPKQKVSNRRYGGGKACR
jgi:hypothetical protein